MHIRFGDVRMLKALALLAAALFAAQTLTQHTTGAAAKLVTSATGAQRKIDFNRDIRPILADKCWACHGPDATAKKIKLRLDSETAALQALVPGHPEQSKLVRRITAKDDAMRMPPADSGRTLSPSEIELLTEWIKQGAQWQQHWSFVPPQAAPLPAVKNTAWPRNALDHFVLARLEQEGLAPAAEADRATLLRRVALDLTGLPPTPQELDAFLNDKTPTAYEKAVDRLLASPRFGERMAFRWLDAARYADTNGYQIDGDRSAWRWRDWVINAFNANKPFDEFVTEQLAGDLLPNPTLDQRIATAFNRNHRTNSEDGIVPAEYAVEYVVDRVDTTATVFLGLTMGCARCHNHKYDPLSQKEYYQLYAYFNSIPEDGRANNYGNSAPWISAPTLDQQRALQKFDREISQAQTQLLALAKRNTLLQRRWERSLKPDATTQWFPEDQLIVHHSLDDNAKPTINKVERIDPSKPEQKIEAKAASPTTDVKAELKPDEIGFKNGAPRFVSGPTGQGVAFDGKLLFDAGKTADFNFRDRLKDYKDQFAISAWFYAESEQSGAIVTHMQDSVGEKDNNLPKNRGYGLFVANGKLHFNLVSVWADDSFRVETAEPIPLKQWQHVLATFDATEPFEKVQLFVNGQKAKLKLNNPRLFRTFGDANANLRIGGGAGPEFRFKGMLDEVRVYKTLPTEDERAILACADSLPQIAAIPPIKRSNGQRLKMLHAWLAQAAPAPLRQQQRKLIELRQQKVRLEAELPTLMVMQEMPQPRPAFVLRRGAYDLPGEQVARNVPAVFPPLPKEAPNNRLGLARWLVSREHPLTARVTVNRFWQMFFGTGLVKTVEDFGAQGELPSHPELLDYLAVEFMKGSAKQPWDVKALLKLIVTSATYRQSSKITPQLLQRDPDNRLLARGPRLRLPAETIRDQALFVSGLLVEKLGGPSVKPYQPAGLLKDMVFSNMTNYDQAKGEGLWRRSLYTFWKRTVMPPAMHVFDASAREACTVRETRTNTPLQALNLMNDVTYVEAARLLAERMLTECGTNTDERLAWAFRLLTSRWPTVSEKQLLIEHLQTQLEHFRRHPDEAAKLLALGEKRGNASLPSAELAAYSVTASLLLNLDEAITKQ